MYIGLRWSRPYIPYSLGVITMERCTNRATGCAHKISVTHTTTAPKTMTRSPPSRDRAPPRSPSQKADASPKVAGAAGETSPDAVASRARPSRLAFSWS